SGNSANQNSDVDIGSDIDSDTWLQTEWRHLHVGDIVLLRDGDAVPGDVMLLSTSDDDGACFVETKNLDGETNLKAKAAPAATVHLTTSRQLAQFACAVETEAPNTQLYSFKGSLQAHDETLPLGIDNLLLRGSVVRNTRWAVGVVLFTGGDTKIMMNAGETPSKRSRIERMMNYQVISQFCLLFVLCLLSAVLGGVYYGRTGSFQAQFVVAYQTTSKRSAPLFGFLTFWTSLILYQTVVPISLYVSIEVVKSFQAYFISQDIDMYYAPLDRRCTPKSWNLSDDLGQVEYIFSDKTGTLTQNVMEFRQCSIRGRVYGEIIGDGDAARAAELRRQMDARLAQACEHPFPFRQSQAATFFDTALYDDLRADSTQARAVIEFFTVLALCHNVVSHVPDAQRPDVIEYKAQSPDEAALVATARDVGFAFLRRERDRVVCSFLGHEQAFTLLATLEFTSARKRMSVIVRRGDGRIMLLCKGADSVVLSRIRAGQDRLRQATLDDLELFANHGLRTLCLAYRLLGEDEYAQWRTGYDRAVASLDDREAAVEHACDAIERELQLIGGTAIEDKLQDGVPETIAQLALAGIKLWVLTGDKTETAINIGYSCNLLNSDMQLIVVNADSPDATREQLERGLREFGDFHADLSFSGGGGGAMAGVAPKSVGAWRRLVRRSDKKSEAKSDIKGGAYDMERRHGLRGVWDNVRTRNIPGAASSSSPLLKREAPLALVIDGHSLKFALEPDLAPLMLELAVRCQSVLCCRVSPLQKALVVRMFVRSAWYPTDTDVVREIVHGFRRRRGKGKRTTASTRPSHGMLNYAASSPHKEVPFGAFPEGKSSPTPAGGSKQWRQQWRQRQAAAAAHTMEGAIPLDDLTAPSCSQVGSPRAGNVDPLNRPGVYQGVQYPETDAALISCLHNLAHMGDPASAAVTSTPQHNILKRLSVYQQQRSASRNMPDFDDAAATAREEDISLHDEGATPSAALQRQQRRRQSANTIGSVRSSIYYLDDGSVQPYTGYAFAQQEHPPQPSARPAERGRRLHKR
ncbi:phospholipid transporting ATPase, partial [Coemansia sp. RSA 25]